VFSDRIVTSNLLKSFLNSYKINSQHFLCFVDSHLREKPAQTIFTDSENFPPRIIFISQEDIGSESIHLSTHGFLSILFWQKLKENKDFNDLQMSDSISKMRNSNLIILCGNENDLTLPIVRVDESE
jgi:hypothetical protein